MSTTNPKAGFSAAIAAAGLGRPGIVNDGAIHRFRCKGDSPDSLNGWYVMRTTGTPHGAFGSWKTGLRQTWRAEDKKISAQEQRELEEAARQAQADYDAEKRQRQAQAADKAKAMIESSSLANPWHPYLVSKSIRPHGIRQLDDALLVPISTDGELTSLQTISADGRKRFLKDGRINSGCYIIDDQIQRDELLICEGFATGATLNEDTGAAVYVAFNAGNLLAVARYVRRQHPKASIIICADDDRWTEGNPGKTKARKAAIAIGAKLLLPDFSGFDLDTKPTDFNDLHRLRRAAQGAAQS